MTKSRGWQTLALAGAVLVGLDLGRVEESAGKRAWQLPVQKVVAEDATVAIACSACSQLPQPAPRDATLSYEQVDAIVKRALRLDDSARSLARVVEPGDWVAIKVNIVTMPLVKNRKLTSLGQGIIHWGQARRGSEPHRLPDQRGEGRRRITSSRAAPSGPRWDRPGQPPGNRGRLVGPWAAFDSLLITISRPIQWVNGVRWTSSISTTTSGWAPRVGAGDRCRCPTPANRHHLPAPRVSLQDLAGVDNWSTSPP